MKRHAHVLSLGVAFVLLLLSCERERTNPIDPQAGFLQERPSKPLGVVAEPGVGFILLRWEPASDRDLAGYSVFRAERSDGDYEFVLGDGPTATQITTGQTSFIDSLDAAGKSFFYRVASVDKDGFRSELSVFVAATVLADEVGPAAPQDPSAVADEEVFGQVVLRWSAPTQDADGGDLTGLESYVVLRSKAGTGSLATVATLNADSLDAAGGILGTGVVEYEDEGLDQLTVYVYTVVAVDGVGNESSQAVSVQVQTGGVSVPTGLQAVGGLNRVTLTWQANAEDDLKGYDVYRSSRSDQGYERLQGSEGTTFTTGQTIFVDSGLTSDQVFFYRIRAVTVRGSGQQSGFVSAQVD